MSTPVCIVATGARTPLGVGTAQSAAAVRAGISRLAHHSLISGKSGEPLPTLSVQRDLLHWRIPPYVRRALRWRTVLLVKAFPFSLAFPKFVLASPTRMRA